MITFCRCDSPAISTIAEGDAAPLPVCRRCLSDRIEARLIRISRGGALGGALVVQTYATPTALTQALYPDLTAAIARVRAALVGRRYADS